MVVCHALRCPLTDCSQWLAPAAMLSGGLIELLRFSRSSAVFTPAHARARHGSQQQIIPKNSRFLSCMLTRQVQMSGAGHSHSIA